MYACQYGHQALKFYNFTPLLLLSLIFLPLVCVKLRNKDLNSANSHLFHVKIPVECAGQTWLNKKPISHSKETSCRMEEAWLYLRLSSTYIRSECMDVHANPGPPKPQTDSSNLVSLQPQRPNNENSPHLSSFAARKVYT